MVSSLITGAATLLLILIGGYVIATGILTIAETTMNSQIEMSAIQDSLHQSQFVIDSTVVGYDNSNWWLVVDLNNTGSTTYGGSDYSHMDLFVYQDAVSESKILTRYSYKTTTPSFQYYLPNDKVNRNMWDPSETLEIRLNNSVIPNWTKFVTSNGVTASTNL
ncbi:MAG: hypothetical protein LUQ50_10715 [Methanospirillum sp.]|uniref:hypothetical protein n=1 Tax=Methanospirillum sp. TaxID=45200 RepID=UPI002373B007|nr:hypothetical protein [Methanospirillum sp.]MDD1729527.1 hypothetical protein [Methanospirillum sp.]